MSKLANTLYVAIDIEASGSRFCDKILAIGVCVGFGSGRIINQSCFASKVPPESEFEPRCWSEFWHAPSDDKQHILDRIDATARYSNGTSRSDLDIIRNFVAFMHELELQYGPFGRGQPNRLVLLSDNPAFDIGAIDRLMDKAGCEAPLRSSFAGYVAINDPSEVMHGLSPAERRWVKEQVTVPHDHWPVNDATAIYMQQLAINAVTDYRRRATEYWQLLMAPNDAEVGELLQ